MAAYTAIDDPEEYFNAVIFTGDGTDNRAITVGFEPNLTWMKQRTDGSGGYVTDSVRGNNAAFQTTNSNAEGTFADMTFESNGITVSSNENLNNEDAHNYVCFNWKESATAGFDIVTYTGDGANRTIAHSLSATPDLVIIKKRNDTGNWMVGGSTTLGGDNKLLLLDTTAALDDNSEVYQSFSSSTFGIGVNAYTNASDDTFVAYAFTSKQGFSKFGSYTGNNNADGTFVNTGFKPAWVMCKQTDGTEGWMIHDNKRNPSNPLGFHFTANGVGADSDRVSVDFVSNGFKWRIANTDTNNGAYIYMAFAESPFVNSSGVPNNAN